MVPSGGRWKSAGKVVTDFPTRSRSTPARGIWNADVAYIIRKVPLRRVGAESHQRRSVATACVSCAVFVTRDVCTICPSGTAIAFAYSARTATSRTAFDTLHGADRPAKTSNGVFRVLNRSTPPKNRSASRHLLTCLERLLDLHSARQWHRPRTHLRRSLSFSTLPQL